MAAAKTRGFNIPRLERQKTGPAREAYKEAYSRQWPHGDSYLRQLAREAQNCRELLTLMRECDG